MGYITRDARRAQLSQQARDVLSKLEGFKVGNKLQVLLVGGDVMASKMLPIVNEYWAEHHHQKKVHFSVDAKTGEIIFVVKRCRAEANR